MALEGTLRDFSFSDILQLISLQRKTGVLTLTNEDNVVTISFLEGKIVGANSLDQRAEDRLGLILRKNGKVTENQLEAALKKQEETLQRLGRILIDSRVVDGEAVRGALEKQILQIVYRVFRWDDGDYQFSQEAGIDYDKDLMVPMVADSIIMEGARMTDEWPFVDRRIPDREVVFVKVDPSLEFETVDEEQDDFDDLGFSFTESPDEEPVEVVATDTQQLSPHQTWAWEAVNGRDSVDEIIKESPLLEFEICKGLADLLEKGLIRETTPEELAAALWEGEETEDRPGAGIAALPFLALPFLVLLGFSLTVMPHNPVNPTFSSDESPWERFSEESLTSLRMERLSRDAEIRYFLYGFYPELEELLAEAPWADNFRISIVGGTLMVTGPQSSGSRSSDRSVPIHIRSLAYEDETDEEPSHNRPELILLNR